MYRRGGPEGYRGTIFAPRQLGSRPRFPAALSSQDNVFDTLVSGNCCKLFAPAALAAELTSADASPRRPRAGATGACLAAASGAGAVRSGPCFRSTNGPSRRTALVVRTLENAGKRRLRQQRQFGRRARPVGSRSSRCRCDRGERERNAALAQDCRRCGGRDYYGADRKDILVWCSNACEVPVHERWRSCR